MEKKAAANAIQTSSTLLHRISPCRLTSAPSFSFFPLQIMSKALSTLCLRFSSHFRFYIFIFDFKPRFPFLPGQPQAFGISFRFWAENLGSWLGGTPNPCVAASGSQWSFSSLTFASSISDRFGCTPRSFFLRLRDLGIETRTKPSAGRSRLSHVFLFLFWSKGESDRNL